MSEKLRFLVVGAYNTAFGYASFAGLYLWQKDHIHYLVIATIAHLFSTISAFATQRSIAFRDQGPLLPAFVRYNISSFILLLFGLSGMALLTDGIGLNPLISQAAVTLLSVIGLYMLHRNYTFRNRFLSQ